MIELGNITEVIQKISESNLVSVNMILSLYKEYIELNERYKNLTIIYEKSLKECAGLRKALDNTYN